ADAAVELAGEGSFQKPHLKMIAAVENLRYGETETGRGTVRGAWDEKTLEMEGDFPDREMSFKGTLGLSPAYPFSVQTRVQRLRLDPFFKERLTGPLAKLSLLFSGEVAANGLLSEIEKASGSVSVAELLADFGGYPVQNDGPFTLRSEQGAWAFENARFKGDNTLLEFNGGLTLLKRWDLFVKGEADLNLIKFLTKEITHGKGMASLDLRISDQWSAPRVRGELTLQDGVVRTKTLSQTIHISTLAAVFNEQRLLLETLEGEMGRGKFRASGKADLEGFGLGRFGFLLELFDARVNLFPDLAASVEGELFFQGSESGKTIKGELTLKKAVYEKKIDLKSAVLELQKKKEEDFSSEIPLVGAAEMNVHIYGKESIWIDNNVAKIPLEIDLFLKGTVDRPLLIGRIDIPRGSVYFRRNDFKVTSGSVEFLNPEKTDPVFNFQAKTEVKRQDKTFAIDLGLSGRLSQFTLSLVSSPPLPETDILSLLTFGKTAQEIAEDTKGGAGGEVTSFVVSELLEEPVQKITGVDRIQVDPYTSGSKSSSGTRLTAEKWLMEDRLRVTYSTSFDPSEEEVLRMIYELNKNISLVGEKDEKGQIGGDIRFRFEFR
ncbi:MAG TPA: translocation/assembly module TamB domain-containing protein, partial [Candidatus Manganitrophaceae bacterium]|nr:translocation/assembly module TamB domain-containing protein [Candidatus Manganitrophaceae bacterium]